MANKQTPTPDDTYDAAADETITRCLTNTPPASFFLFAGAGSGKTRSLVSALKEIKKVQQSDLNMLGQKVGVITYTNKACDEIKERLGDDPLFEVSTIHSFAWSLIQGLNHDIREWLKAHLQIKIQELEEKETKGRPGTKASLTRIKQIANTNNRLSILDKIKKFTYNPDGDNNEQEDLNHSEVIKCAASFLTNKPLMQKMLVKKFPTLLIDESQDTNRHLMDAFFHVQSAMRHCFSLGVIGDTMQRIYSDGKDDLGDNLPDDWKRPVKNMNHRSTKRIIKLVNRIRAAVDDQEQLPRTDQNEGVVRLFIIPSETTDKNEAELQTYAQMAEITKDANWHTPSKYVKTLALEHHMAARRLGFLPMWNILDRASKLSTGLRKGELPGLQFFSQKVLPILDAFKAEDKFTLASIVRSHSPLLDKKLLASLEDNQLGQIGAALNAVKHLNSLWDNGKQPLFMDVIKRINSDNLLQLPEIFKTIIEAKTEEAEEGEDENPNETIVAWLNFLETPFDQIGPYSQYVSGESQFDTHQGVKGLQFDRVCVIIDDHEARGFTFSYEKFFGAKEESRRPPTGKESSTDKTRRLFYVTCSRAKESLAVIAYTKNPHAVKSHVIAQGWFAESEVILV